MTLTNDLKNYQITNLSSLLKIKDYYQSFRLPKQLPKVIEYASQGIDPDGLMNNHQHRIGYRKCLEAAKELAKHEVEIKNARTFEAIFEMTETVKHRIFGLGNLWSYDTALRIGFSKKVFPKDVYVQAGVKKGVKKILDGNLPKGRSLPLCIFPAPLQKLEPYQVENFLCIYGKDYKFAKKERT